MQKQPDIKELLEAGVHFGHQTKRWNPKMKDFIFTEKNGIHILDLAQTEAYLTAALAFLTQKASEGEVLFVGTKRQAQEIVERVAKEVGSPYVTNRWPGGLLTNFAVTRQNVKRMIEYETGMSKGFENRTKQEVTRIGKELERLQRLYGGFRDIHKLPSVIVLADPKHEKLAVREANKLKVPIVAIVDTNCDPDEITCMVPGNDDAIRSITLFFTLFGEAVKIGKTPKAKEVETKVEAKPKVQEIVKAPEKTVKKEDTVEKKTTKTKAV